MKNLMNLMALLLCLMTACHSSEKKSYDKQIESLNIEVEKMHIQSMQKDKQVQEFADSLEKMKAVLKEGEVEVSLEQEIAKTDEQSRELHQKMNDWMRQYQWVDSSKNPQARVDYMKSQLKEVKNLDEEMDSHVEVLRSVLKKMSAASNL